MSMLLYHIRPNPERTKYTTVNFYYGSPNVEDKWKYKNRNDEKHGMNVNPLPNEHP